MAVIGTTLFKSTALYYSPVFGRGGQSANFAIEVLNLEGTATLDVIVQHKNSEDTTWTTFATFAQFTAVALKTVSASGAKQMLRFEYNAGGTAATDFVHLFVFAPTWQD